MQYLFWETGLISVIDVAKTVSQLMFGANSSKF